MSGKLAMAIPMILALALSPLTASAQDSPPGPFGLRKGMTRAEIEKLGPILDEGPSGILRVGRVPRPDPNYQSYWVVVTPRAGVCAVMAAGKTVLDDPNGALVQASFAKAKAALTEKYGEPVASVDTLVEGSTLGAPTQWTASLSAGQRTLAVAWKPAPGAEGVSAVSLEAAGVSDTRAYVRAVFAFDNQGDCISEFKRIRRTGGA
jgi:hypothetical protein